MVMFAVDCVHVMSRAVVKLTPVKDFKCGICPQVT